MSFKASSSFIKHWGGLQPSLDGLGPTSEPVDGRVQAWTRHVSDQLSASEHRQDMFTGRLVAINPSRWEKGPSQRDLPVLTVSGNPLATRHTHVTTTGCRQLDRSKRKGSQRDPILWIPFLCIQSDRPIRVGEGVSWKGTSLELWFPCWLTSFVTGETRRTFRLRRTGRSAYSGRTQSVRRTGRPAGTSTQCWSSLSTAVVSWTFLSTWLVSQVCFVSPDSRIVRESPPVSIHAETPSDGSLRQSESPPVSFQVETSSNVSDWRVGAKFSLSFQVHHCELQLVRNRLVPPPCLGFPSP